MAIPDTASRWRTPLITAMSLVGIAAMVIAVILFVANESHDRIERNEQALIAAQLHTVVPASMHDNDLAMDFIDIAAPESFGTRNAVRVYRGRMHGSPVAAI